MTIQQLRTIDDLPCVTLPEDYQGNPGPFLARMYQQHGPIFRSRTNWGGDLVYMVGPEANRFVLASNRLKFSHREGWGHFFGVIETYGDGLLTMDGPEHDQHRRMMNPAFAISYMDRYLPLMNRIIRERTAAWPDHGEVDVFAEARKITFDVAAEALVGLKTGPEVDHFREIFFSMITLDQVSIDGDDYARRLGDLQRELYALLLPKIRQRRQQPTDDVLGMLVRARDEQGRALTDEQLIAHTNILLVAGHETSTSLSAWLLYLLSLHPDYARRVLDEQDALLAPDADPTLEDIKRMKLLEHALSEAERLYPPVSNGPRGVLEDFEFGGYHIPAGTHVFYSISGAHRIPTIFAEPDTFDPDRFAPPREEHKTPYALVGFGGGPRICIGINFAQVEIKALLSHLLRNYQLELAPNQRIQQMYMPTSMPVNGIRMHVSRREA
ncbi:MAG TPA: cytochrome P450 [Roseiflexaceae bacterium]|nr:cytochrome P450 [Roseiflexaceae bacterium]